MLKKTTKYFFITCAIYLTLVVLEYARIAFVNDYSLLPIPQQESAEKAPHSVTLISYANGHSYYIQNQNAMAASAINKGIDFIFNYRGHHVPQSYKKQHPHFQHKTGGGLWLWKPYLIHDTLQKMAEGDFLIYMDANFIFKKPITSLLQQMPLGRDILLFTAFGNPQEIRTYTKGNVLHHMDCQTPACQTAPNVAAGVMFIRNTEASRAFIGKWLTWCEKINIMDSRITENMPHHSSFRWSFFDLSVLSILAHQNRQVVQIKDPTELFNYAFWAHRKPSPASRHKKWYTLYGVKGMPNRITGKALTSVSLLNFPPLVLLRKYIYESIV